MGKIKSEAQRRRLHELVAKGKLKPSVLAGLEGSTDDLKLPERVAPKGSFERKVQESMQRFRRK